MIEAYKKMYTKLEDLPSKYITAKQVVNLKSLGIDTIYDLIYYFPRAYDNRSNVKNIGDLTFNEYVVVKASVMSVLNMPNRSGKKIVKAMITDGTGIMEVLWFGMPYISKSLKVGEEYIFIGQTKKSNLFQFINPEYKLYKGQEKETAKEILPIYSSNKNITQNSLRKLVEKFLVNFLNYFEENIPKELIKEYKIMERKSAVKNIQYPVSMKEIEEAKRRFAIEELLILELGILKNRFIIDSLNTKKYEIEGKKEKVREFLSQLTFNLTNAQKKVIKEIYDEISNGKIVNRLIQGDVGSGKTAVAAATLYATIKAGYQTAIMAPTEILANQHFETFFEFFKDLNISVALLTSSTPKKERNTILSLLEVGEIELLIGTHSLIQEDVKFNNLKYVITDEQHRFGVRQRQLLSNKGEAVNSLMMTATPIPRSLAITLITDIKVSTIDELPAGRKKVQTYKATNKSFYKVLDNIRMELDNGRQGYVVCPLIEESEKMDLQNVEETYENIKNYLPDDYKIAILHGKMNNKEKDAIVERFLNKEIHILISTTVIEVGVNVPNATFMIIVDAHRFGLATLHQLRGRVGRSKFQSYCILVTDSKSERIDIMCLENDGFKIAEFDLKQRGPGDFFGTKQSGVPSFKVADLINDVDLMYLAKKLAVKIIEVTNNKERLLQYVGLEETII